MRIKNFFLCTSFLVTILLNCGQANGHMEFVRPLEFENPVMDTLEETNTNVYLHKGKYYYAITNPSRSSIDIMVSDSLTSWRNVETTRVFNLSNSIPQAQIFGPKIKMINDIFYIYFFMTLDGLPEGYRNYVIKADYSYSPISSYGYTVQLLPTGPDGDMKSYHGTVLERDNGQLYLLYTGSFNESDLASCIFIAPMSSPAWVSGPRVLLRAPEAPWETQMGRVVDAPQILQKNGRTFLVYSASSWSSPNSCLGILAIDFGRHPLVKANWKQEKNGCVFWRNDEEHVFGTGRASFTTSPDGLESWMLYVATNSSEENQKKTVRAEPFGWDSNGAPQFPRPAGLAIRHALPSGENK